MLLELQHWGKECSHMIYESRRTTFATLNNYATHTGCSILVGILDVVDAYIAYGVAHRGNLLER